MKFKLNKNKKQLSIVCLLILQFFGHARIGANSITLTPSSGLVEYYCCSVAIIDTEIKLSQTLLQEFKIFIESNTLLLIIFFFSF